MYKAVSLISGGLDSLLATKLVLEQGIMVEGINFFTGFSGDHNYSFKQFESGRSAEKICHQLGIKLHVVDVVQAFKPVLLNPKYGYGANLNPCLDCKLFMIMHAHKWMNENGFDFLVTGEVLGQRPKSQRKDTLPLATQYTSDLIVRPLSAKLLPITLPERRGWIKRELLYGFSGRSRKPQLELAKKFGLQDLPQPGGGCLLTDPGFCRRLQDLWDHSLAQDYTVDDLLLFRVGRHLRINSDFKVVIGRNEAENNFLEKFLGNYVLLSPVDHPGALVVVVGNFESQALPFLASLAAYFSKGRESKAVKISVREPKNVEYFIEAIPLSPNDILPGWYI